MAVLLHNKKLTSKYPFHFIQSLVHTYFLSVVYHANISWNRTDTRDIIVLFKRLKFADISRILQHASYFKFIIFRRLKNMQDRRN